MTETERTRETMSKRPASLSAWTNQQDRILKVEQMWFCCGLCLNMKTERMPEGSGTWKFKKKIGEKSKILEQSSVSQLRILPIILPEEGVTHRNVGDYSCHLSRHPFVSEINISWNMRVRCKKSLAKLKSVIKMFIFASFFFLFCFTAISLLLLLFFFFSFSVSKYSLGLDKKKTS